jgi:hypothetical protein
LLLLLFISNLLFAHNWNFPLTTGTFHSQLELSIHNWNFLFTVNVSYIFFPISHPSATLATVGYKALDAKTQISYDLKAALRLLPTLKDVKHKCALDEFTMTDVRRINQNVILI